jgi:hypothetical protein
MGYSDQVEDANEEPLGRPLVLSSVNRSPSMTSLCASSSTSPAVSLKSASADSRTTNATHHHPISALPYLPPNGLTLMDPCMPLGGLRFRTSHSTRMTQLRALAEREVLLEETLKRRARHEALWIRKWPEQGQRRKMAAQDTMYRRWRVVTTPTRR